MGCGASSLDPLDVNLNRHSNNPLRRYRVVQPIMEEPPKILLPPLPKDDIVFAFPGYTRHEEVVGVKETNNKDGHAKPPSISNIGRSESDSIDRDDAFTGPASPSFREYCIHSRDPSSMDMDHSHDDSDSGESIDNMDNDDSIVSNTKPPRKETTNPNNV